MQFDLSDLEAFNALSVKDRRVYLNICRKMQSHVPAKPEINPEHSTEKERLGSEDHDSREVIQRLSTIKNRGGRKARRKSDGGFVPCPKDSFLEVLDGDGIHGDNRNQASQNH